MTWAESARRVWGRVRRIFARPPAPPPAPHLALGRRGEELAAAYLRGLGYRLVAANFELHVGRDRRGAPVRTELDLVAYEGPVLCFVEVKTRASDWFAAPEVNVTLRKRRQIARAARAYRRLFGLSAAPFRYDVVTVILPPPAADGRPAAPHLRLLRGFWTEAEARLTTPPESVEFHSRLRE